MQALISLSASDSPVNRANREQQKIYQQASEKFPLLAATPGLDWPLVRHQNTKKRDNSWRNDNSQCNQSVQIIYVQKVLVNCCAVDDTNADVNEQLNRTWDQVV